VRIGEVAAAAGVSPRALRYYEERNLLPAERSAGGQRHYTEAAVERVRLIQQLYAAGLPSRVIAELLPCVHTGIVTPEQLTLLTAERDRIDRQAAQLAEARDRLDAVINAATASADGSVGACTHGPGPTVAAGVRPRR
jgi:DNA-binding transcriptional MerR regulator